MRRTSLRPGPSHARSGRRVPHQRRGCTSRFLLRMERAGPAGGGRAQGPREWRACRPIGGKRGVPETNELELLLAVAAEARAPPENQMRHIWTAALRNCAAPSRARRQLITSPTSSPLSHLFIHFSKEATRNPSLKLFFALMRDGARSHPTHSLTFMGLWDQKDRNSNSKSPAAV